MNRKLQILLIILAVLLIAGFVFVWQFYFAEPEGPNKPVNTQKETIAQQKAEVRQFINKYLQSIKDGDVYYSFNNALSEKGWQDLIDQCETIEANKNKGYIRLLQEGRLQKLWRQCAFSDQFNFKIKSIKSIGDNRFIVNVLITDLDGRVVGLDQHPDWANGRPIEVRKEIFGEYRTDEWDFF